MKNLKLLIPAIVIAILFIVSCSKDKDSPEPTPAPTTTNTGITGKNLKFAEQGYNTNSPSNSGSMQLIVPNSVNFTTTITGCGMGTGLDSYTLQVGTNYELSFTINGSVVYSGDIQINSNGELVELNGNTAGAATIKIENCNSALGDQIVVRP